MLTQPIINHSFEFLMKTKDQSNQNPENENLNQDENSLPVEETVENVETIENQAEVAAEAMDAGTPAEVPALEAEVPATVEEELPAEVTTVEVEQVPVEAESEEIAAETEVPAVEETEPVAKVAVAEEPEAAVVAEEPEAAVVAEEPEAAVVAEEALKLSPVAEPEPVAEMEPVAVETVVEEMAVPVVEETLLVAEESADEDETDEIEEHLEEANPLFEGLNRDQLVEKLEDLVKDPNVNAIKSAVGLVRLAFLKLNKEFKQELYQKLAEVNVDADAETPAEVQPVQDDAIEERFKAAFNIYKQNKAKYNEEQEKVKVKNLEAKTRILEELKVLINSEETLKKTYDEFKTLQERWKTIGMVPKGEINTLWQNYHFLVEKFFDKVKINKELKDLDLKKNLEVKVHLCEKAEELLLETSIIKSFKQLQQYHEEWKEVGPVPQDKKDELWERFRSATEKINERRREYYNEMQDSLEQNYAAKVILCEKAEQLMAGESDSIKAWQDTTAQITELLKIWKTIGPAPKKQNNEIWARFKTSLDGFFNTKKEYFNKLKEQQMHNFNLKLDLCVQAESLRNSTDWKNTSRELINLQNEWKKIGPVPRKQSDRIWKRFRAACDEFFSTKTEYFKNVSSHEDENMKLKLDLIEKVKEFEVGDDRNQAVETLKDFQRQWMEIGHVPIKEKEKLQADFRLLINKHFEKLKMESMSMGANNYRNRVERMAKDSPDAGRVISKERSFVLGKIQQLQDEIKTWENNIGFFANSKTANLLKQEFEKKIDKAKEELQMLEAKLKMLREANQ
ncbi:MAG: hypothetical protein FD166_956 [Bacteroidetes bacterium]|nr:MAG: hypothetical protein FD166_956 [Bacteroidota bacterium]